MKIAIIGYGKMGKEVEKAAKDRGHEIACIVDKDDWFSFPGTSNIAIEFTEPGSAFENVIRCFDAGIPVVSGTTGWNEKLEEAKRMCFERGKTLVHAPNFSPGVNIFFQLNQNLAEMIEILGQYAPCITETHHVQKLDTPSGTAIELANGIIDCSQKFKKWVQRSQSSTEQEIPVVSHRVDQVTGTHVVCWQGPDDVIEIKHTAMSRAIFANGAILAAELVLGQSGFFTMKDLLNI